MANKFIRYNPSGSNYFEYDSSVAQDGSGPWLLLPIDASQITASQLALARGGTKSDLSATGGTSQVLKQVSTGAPVTVGQLASSDLSDGPFTTFTPTYGTWTPVIGSDAGQSGQTYSVQIGQYFKLGRLVIANFVATLSAKGTISAGTANIQGLPFTSQSTAGFFQAGTVCEFENLVSNWASLSIRVQPNTTFAYLVDVAAGGSSSSGFPNATEITNTTRIIGSMSYLTP
jgi:hypothetical protein